MVSILAFHAITGPKGQQTLSGARYMHSPNTPKSLTTMLTPAHTLCCYILSTDMSSKPLIQIWHSKRRHNDSEQQRVPLHGKAQCLHHQFPFSGALTPISSLTATAVTQPELSLPAIEYTVSLRRAAQGRQGLCTSFEDSRSAVPTNGQSLEFTDLEEFSTYSVTVMASFDVFGAPANRLVKTDFTTLGAGKSNIMCCPSIYTCARELMLLSVT